MCPWTCPSDLKSRFVLLIVERAYSHTHSLDGLTRQNWYRIDTELIAVPSFPFDIDQSRLRFQYQAREIYIRFEPCYDIIESLHVTEIDTVHSFLQWRGTIHQMNSLLADPFAQDYPENLLHTLTACQASCLCFSNNYLACGTVNGDVVLYDLLTYGPIRVLKGHTRTLQSVS